MNTGRAILLFQRGVTTVLTAFVLMLLVLAGLAAALNMSGSDIHDSSTQGTSVQALFLAESGVERASYVIRNGGIGSCTGLALGAGAAVALANGTLEILNNPAPAIVTGNCRFRVRGAVGQVMRTVEVDVRPGGSSLFSEYFSALGSWAQVLAAAPNNQGSSSFDNTSNCPASVCTNASNTGTGALQAQTPATTSNQRVTGYRWMTLPTAITTGAGLTVSTFLGYAKHAANGNPRTATVRVLLEDTAAAITTVIWDDPTPLAAPACNPVPPPVPAGCWLGGIQTVNLPAGRTYNRIRLFFDLEERGTNVIRAWFDAVNVQSGGGNSTIVRWVEP